MKYRMRVTAAAVGLAAVGVFAVACGGSSSSSTSAASGGGQSPGTGGGNAAFQAYLSCLSQNGVTITLPSGRPGGGGGPGGG
ncbi:MAG TPA: hypothetical protein VJT31_14220, partial [Rugosimonospora sp.]|nr:hypothetical protein [Rugosimonospora sp.]